MARDYVIEVVGAHRVERGILDVERSLAEELREATRKVERKLMADAIEAAPTPRPGALAEDGADYKGRGIGSEINFPEARGGLRRLAGRAPGGRALVSLTYEVSLFIEKGNLAAYHETGTGLYGPAGSKYTIPKDAGTTLLLTGGTVGIQKLWGGNQGGDFRGGAGEKLPIFDHVNHPGIRPRPFLEDSVQANTAEVDLIYDRAVASALKGF